MDNVKLIEYNLQIKVGCPNCDSTFDFLNYGIPEEVPTYVICDNCNIPLCVKPFEIVVKAKTSAPNHIVKEAKKIVKSYGFSTKQINQILKDLDTTSMSLETLVKTILSKVDQNEYATT